MFDSNNNNNDETTPNMALKGIKVVELVGLAPAPFCGMILSDFGAKVIRVDRVKRGMEASEACSRGKQSIALDLKQEDGKEILKKLCTTADVLIEPFRPGVMENLGLGPKDLMARNQRLIYTRMSGFGQTGPLSKAAGHDINYVATSGVLSMLGLKEPGKPSPPANLLADYAGGGLTGAFGILAAIIEREKSGKGQVIDANLVEGTSYVSSSVFLTRLPEKAMSQIIWPAKEKRGQNLLDGGAPFYQTYRTKDNKFMAVGSLEPQFYSAFMTGMGLDESKYNPMDYESWPQFEKDFQDIFITKTQEEWTAIFTPLDCCVTPVVDVDSAWQYPHNKERGSFLPNKTPRPAPLLERTPGIPDLTEPRFGQHTQEVLEELGYSMQDIKSLVSKKAIVVDEGKGVTSSKL